ncbi:MAG: phenylalanine--tRNA ligase subunit beta [Mycoplasmatales bacterium]|nr:phenylalanine--tRNA ligase subunit beta [Mycoplasmatales bacterium]
MLFSFKELKRLANLPDKIGLNDVVKAINSIGFEVESTKKFADVEGIKFGEILKVSKNPNGDNLYVCEINFNDKKRIIQTTADNVFEGMFVIAFVPGSRFEKINFDKKELKNVISEGMLASISEFGIDKELLRDYKDEITEFKNVSLDDDPIEYLGLQDTIIDIDILSNRSDAQSYIIMSREIAAYFGTEPLKINPKENTFESGIKVKKGDFIELGFIEGKNDFEISLKEQILLAKSNVKSINNIVDLTNLTLLMTGQPTHAYDKSKVGNVFSASYDSSKIEIFGKKEIELENNLIITSEDKPVSLAGVIGFENTGIDNGTKSFIIELGKFNTKDVRKSLKTIKMTTDSGIQASKNISKGTILLASKYISSKLNSFSNLINISNPKNIQINYSINKLEKISGFNISKEEKYYKALNSLKILGFKFENDNKKIIAPLYRHDLLTQQDINEEILRFYGYDNIPLYKPLITPSKISNFNDLEITISSKGYFEVNTYTLTSKTKNIFNPFNFKNTIELSTYISKEREVIRNSQIPSIVEIADYNQKRGIKKISLFSKGMINNGAESMILASNEKSFNDMKQDLVDILPKGIQFIVTNDKNMHPGYSADIILNDKKIGYIGKTNPKIINNSILIAEWIINHDIKKIKYNTYSQEPLKNRDITFNLKNNDNISDKINDLDYYDIKIIDRFITNNERKITVRLFGKNEKIKKIDKTFN